MRLFLCLEIVLRFKLTWRLSVQHSVRVPRTSARVRIVISATSACVTMLLGNAERYHLFLHARVDTVGLRHAWAWLQKDVPPNPIFRYAARIALDPLPTPFFHDQW